MMQPVAWYLRIVFLAWCAAACWAPAAAAQTLHRVHPSDTDPAITNFNSFHFALVDPSVESRNNLFVFLPGTLGVPAIYQEILQSAALKGFHSIGLTYVNGQAVNFDVCQGTTDSNCHENVRLEIIEGVDHSADIDVDRSNSIENRLIRLIAHLIDQFPEEGWERYLQGDSNVVWQALLLAGHSQGAGHAGLMAKRQPVRRCLMFAGLDWFGVGAQPAGWQFEPSATPLQHFYGFIHQEDELIPTLLAERTWEAYGIDAFGPTVLVENVSGSPFEGSHMFLTGLPPRGQSLVDSNEPNFHGATVVDSAIPLNEDDEPVYAPLWEFMMAGPSVRPAIESSVLESNRIRIGWFTETNLIYQLQSSFDLTTWTNTVVSFEGADAPATVEITAGETPMFFRTITFY